MSDCSRKAWSIPAWKDREEGVLYAPELTEWLNEVDVIEVDSVEHGLTRFVRERECHIVTVDKPVCSDDPYEIELSCGHVFESLDDRLRPNYCPNCGAKVVG